jgi:hypothetical protein
MLHKNFLQNACCKTVVAGIPYEFPTETPVMQEDISCLAIQTENK